MKISKYEINKTLDKDHVATPRWVVEDMYERINIQSFKQCWFPFNHYDSEFKLKGDELKINYLATHIFDNLGNDFFKTLPPKDTDLMISNPPFSKQNEIIERSFWLVEHNYIKSFALLLPLSTLETETRADMYEKYQDKLSIGIFKKRIKFLGHKTQFNKACCWVCYNVPSLSKEPFWWIGGKKMKVNKTIKKKETNLCIYKTDVMFDFVKLQEQEPHLFDELVKDYPLQKGIHMLEVVGE